MKMALKASSSRKWVALLTAGCLAGIGLQGCTTDSHDGAINPILVASTPNPVPVGPTLAPVEPNTTTPITTPNFAPITPPPVSPSLPEQPQFGVEGGFQAEQPFDSTSYRLTLTNFVVRGTIASVDVQVFNNTCGTDVTGVLNPTAVAQFKSLLIGRGNTFADAGGFDFSFIFPTDPRFYDDFRIVKRFSNEIVLVPATANVPAQTRTVVGGDDVIISLIIRDSFGQVLRVDDSIFNPGESRTDVRGTPDFPPCGNLVATP